MPDRVQIIEGDSRLVLPTLGAETLDACVTDPPYELTSARPGGRSEATRGKVMMGGFMGMKWDGTGIAFNPAFWLEVFRVLKPGAHLLAFGGTRTYHRMVCAIEDAGFEIRDQIDWIYGSGFPKSLDVSKAIDKAKDYKLQSAFRRAWVSAVEEAGLQLPGNSKHDWTIGEHAPGDKWWTEFQQWVPGLTDREREKIERIVVGKGFRIRRESTVQFCGTSDGEYDLTAPASDDAKMWEGWGTALKPAHEPICLARKPLEKGLTVADNVAKWGTGALNIDGCRIDLDGDYKCGANGRPSQTGLGDNYDSIAANQHSELGRWPANIIHDGSPEVLAAFPQAPGQIADASTNSDSRKTQNVYGAMRRGRDASEASHDIENNGEVGFKMRPGARRLDEGSAARFFYCAKASKTDRSKQNHHPTVKPTELMRYLCRLVTPPNGTVLDPFLGSGSTAKACVIERFNIVGIEQDAEYIKIAKRRIKGGLQVSLI